ncbi:hypothetical protein BP00DRAFT_162098 [Aspergillus indologenus CBS 114.80]|uniref:Uncharacterized protein n=1 Tax=Aspergillus indologenus CBS 114.80 TaxID=1450541 RepID=A0A2V5IAB7_9EURO|nr:hypothetical protein BP00DRAFT_162098 [Aspergillus indologenus CBS 114.80]
MARADRGLIRIECKEIEKQKKNKNKHMKEEIKQKRKEMKMKKGTRVEGTDDSYRVLTWCPQFLRFNIPILLLPPYRRSRNCSCMKEEENNCFIKSLSRSSWELQPAIESGSHLLGYLPPVSFRPPPPFRELFLTPTLTGNAREANEQSRIHRAGASSLGGHMARFELPT